MYEANGGGGATPIFSEMVKVEQFLLKVGQLDHAVCLDGFKRIILIFYAQTANVPLEHVVIYKMQMKLGNFCLCQ